MLATRTTARTVSTRAPTYSIIRASITNRSYLPPTYAWLSKSHRLPPLRSSFSTTSIQYAETVVKVPQMAESISEGTLSSFTKQVGDYVEQDEEIASIETDKIDVSVNAPEAGTIKELLVSEGDTVTVGQEIAKMEPGGSGGGGEKEASAPAKEPASQDQPTSSDPEPKKDSPPPPPPKKESPPPPPSQKEEKPAPPKEEKKAPPKDEKMPDPPKPATGGPGSRSENRVKMNRMRLRIAERLKQSQNTAASLTTFNEVDMSGIMEFRKRYKDEILKKTGVKLGFMSAFSKAAILAMKDIPAVNASIEGPGGGDTIVYRDYVDISVAVATPKGLVTPVIRNAESLDMIGIEQAIAELGKKVRVENQTNLCVVLIDLLGSRQQANNRRHGGRELHYQQRRRVRLHDGHTNHQSTANSCAWLACDHGPTGGCEWQD
jgi:2-oxoglutarate dehydrogenase E2 component (dihydrolipoamide succinyltransferase)